MIMITSQARAQTRITAEVVRSGWTSSSQAKPNSDSAAGQTPSRAGKLEQAMIRIGPGQPAQAEVQRAQRVDHPPDRSQSNDSGTSPTHTQTKHEAEDRVGQPVRTRAPPRDRPSRTGPARAAGRSAGRGLFDQALEAGNRPAADRRRTEAVRQASSRTAKEIASAAAAPARTKANGSGRSCRDAMPCRGIGRPSRASTGHRTFKITMIFSSWCDSTSKLPAEAT